jgi:hypothetical protein
MHPEIALREEYRRYNPPLAADVDEAGCIGLSAVMYFWEGSRVIDGIW